MTVESALVERLDVPVGVGQEAIQTRLIGGLCEFAVDAENGLSLCDEQASEVFGEVASLALVAEEVGELAQRILHDLGKLDDSRHEQMLRNPIAPDRNRGESDPFPLFYRMDPDFAKLQPGGFTKGIRKIPESFVTPERLRQRRSKTDLHLPINSVFSMTQGSNHFETT